jgi:ribosomal protein L11 methyltransferase
VVPATALAVFLDALDDEGLSVAAFEEPGGEEAAAWWRIEMLHTREPDEPALAARLAALAERVGLARIDLTLSPVPREDWLARTAEQFPPQHVGRFWIHGSHVEGPASPGAVPILIDAGLAFGSGEHPSTRGCLLALDRLARRRRFRRVLDLGCGSGILAIAAAKCWPARVVAADNDPQAVLVARENAARNGVARHIQCLVSDGLASPRVRAEGLYDLIVANILAGPLIGLAKDLSRALAPNGALILSGLLTRQAEAVRAAHRPQRLRVWSTITDGPWATLVLTPLLRPPRVGRWHRPRR